MQSEHGLVRRLEELAPGTRVRLASTRIGTLREVSFTRAVVELDSGEERRRDIAPACEVEVIESLDAALEVSPPTTETRNSDRKWSTSPPDLRYGSEGSSEQAQPGACTVCRNLTDRPRFGQRYCSGRCRQRAYRQRRKVQGSAPTLTEAC